MRRILERSSDGKHRLRMDSRLTLPYRDYVRVGRDPGAVSLQVFEFECYVCARPCCLKFPPQPFLVGNLVLGF